MNATPLLLKTPSHTTAQQQSGGRLGAMPGSVSLSEALRSQVEFYGQLAAHLETCLKNGDRPDEFWLIAAKQLANAVGLDAGHALDDTDRIQWLESQSPFLSPIALKINGDIRGESHSVSGAIDAARFSQ